MQQFALTMLLSALLSQASTTNIPFNQTSTIHVYASSGEWVGSQYGEKLTGALNGQMLVLRTRDTVNPISPGDYSIHLIRKRTLHGAELDQQYCIKLTDGTELHFDLIGICARGLPVCFGVSMGNDASSTGR